jgi:hypothetical protein
VAAPAAATAQPLVIQNRAGAPQSVIDRIERAAVDEVNNHVDPAYSKAVSISWDNSGTAARTDWPVALVSPGQWSPPCGVCWGYHALWQTPVAYVRWANNDLVDSEYVFSHEVVEMAADSVPGTAPEICDPVAWKKAQLDGVTVAVFELPDGSTWPQWPPPSAPPNTTPLTVTSPPVATQKPHSRRHHRRYHTRASRRNRR